MDAFISALLQFAVAAVRAILLANFAFLPYQFDSSTELGADFDFIVVGAGAAGSVVASRLSETGAEVLLLEAGGPAPPESAVPGMFPLLLWGDGLWKIKTKPQLNSQQGYINSSAYLTNGKMMGGGTAVNLMVYIRGNKEDYNHWADLGNLGWDYQSVLPYFLKSEDFRGDLLPGNERHHAKGGMLGVEPFRTVTKIKSTMFEAANELGYNEVDANGPDQIGMSHVHQTTRDGVRDSASESFLRPVIDRTNLHVRANAYVTRVLFNEKKRAVGVEFFFQGKFRVARARKEVILSAGALNTPKLLMLSGVGPRQHLRQIGIPLVAAVEGVGQNLNDHPMVFLTWKVKEGTSTSMSARSSPQVLLDYIKNRKGALSDGVTLQNNMFLNLGGDDPTWADFMLLIHTLSYGLGRGKIKLGPVETMKNEIYSDLFSEFYDVQTLAMNACLLRTKSRGSVTLVSSNPYDDPLVDLNFFDHPDDMKLFIKGVRMAIWLLNTDAAKRELEAEFQSTLLTPCKHFGANTDDYWECYIRHVATSFWHFGGTAKMAPDWDAMGVVSDRLRVRGVSGLRVIDASIMPQVSTSNTMAPTYMIAEKGADMIKQDWGYPVDGVNV